MKICLFCWVDKIRWEDESGMTNDIGWCIEKVWILYSQHYIMAPLAMVGILSIYFLIVRLYRKNRALNLRLKKVEREMRDKE